MLKIFNTLSGEKEEFRPLSNKEVKMYLCGPTVYDFGHLGHARSAISFDLIRKYLIYKGYNLKFVSNYTDIDDKMIKRAKEEGISVKELAEKIIPEYEKDYRVLRIKKPDFSPKATEYIDTIIEIVQKLLDKGYAYKSKNGIYFDVTKFSEYGKLSKQNLEELQMGARVEVNPDKRNPQDFAIWKFKKNGEPFWPADFGEGRPGWHIECSAMIYKLLGEQIDIHGGGYDLTFPHHECEIAQTECFTGKKPFVKYWVHNGFVKINDEKMSKSLNNFFTIKEILGKYSPSTIRFLLVQTHYRAPLNFSFTVLEQAHESQKRLQDFYFNIKNLKSNIEKDNIKLKKWISELYEDFEKAMDDDFEVPKTLSKIFDFTKKINILIKETGLNEQDKEKILELLNNINSVLDIIDTEEEKISEEVLELVKEREQARKEKNWQKSDEIRDKLKKLGYIIEDSAEGAKIKKIT